MNPPDAAEHGAADHGAVDRPEPPVDLPRAPRLFWSARPEFATLTQPASPHGSAVLERLGPPPFAKSGFPFIGFLATIYDHVATHAGRRASE
jgi:hypothetical protein